MNSLEINLSDDGQKNYRRKMERSEISLFNEKKYALKKGKTLKELAKKFKVGDM